MIHSRRIISGLLTLAVAAGPCTAWLPAASAAAPREGIALQASQTTGSISLTLTFDLPQTLDAVQDRKPVVTLTGSGRTVTIELSSGAVSGADGLNVNIEAQNAQGVPLTTEARLGAYQVVISGLPVGQYTMEVAGDGYTACSTPVDLTEYAQHVLMSNDDGTFSLGDVNGDGTVTAEDRTLLADHLGTQVPAEVEIYDLNGDGKVNVVDLSYVNKVMDLERDPRVLSTSVLASADLDDDKLIIVGDPSDLFGHGGAEVILKPASEDAPLSIPITLESEAEISQISIASPSAEGAIQAGTAVVEYLENGDTKTMTVPFDISAPEGVYAISRTAGQSVVTISLGQKVAVKKVTIQVTQVEGQTGEKPQFATVSQIQFLKDIVSDEMKADIQVKGLAASVGDGTVTLAWDSLPNVTGYTVQYGTSRDKLDKTAGTNTNRIVISNLTNGTSYYFQVTAVSLNWMGVPSSILPATPLAATVPGAPSNLVVEPANGALRISWSKTKNADHYQVYYRAEGASEFIPWGNTTTATSAVITGLTNGSGYEVAVKAGNHKGLGPYSTIALGTPEKENYAMPALPEDNRIDNGEITSIVMADPGNVDKKLCPSFDLSKDLTDNDPNTYWVAQEWYRDSQITFTFENAHDMNYMLLVPYLAVPHKNIIKTYELVIRDEEGQVLLDTSYRAPSITAEGYIILAFPEVKGAKSITLGMSEVEGGGARVSIAEIAFYNSDTLSGDIAALFTDGTFTALKGGVEQENITALRTRLSALGSFYLDLSRLTDELDLAQNLLNRTDNALGLVKEDFQSRSASAAADRAAGQTASDLQPLGVTAQAGSTVAIYAELPDDATVYVVPTQFYGESGVWKGRPVALKNGRNYITVEKIGSLSDTRGGPLYLTYAGSHPEEIRLQVRSGSGVYTMPVLELSDWYTMGEPARKAAIRTYVEELTALVNSLSASGRTTNIRNVTEISTPSVLLSLPADQVLSGLQGVGNDESAMVDTMYQNILAWEEELFIANQVQGIIDADAALEDYTYPMTTRQNIRYMRMFAGAFMYAAGNHIGVEYGSTAALVQGKPTAVTGEGRDNGLFGWGIAHEIGHNMDKLGKAECTNNIYSLAMQAWDGGSMALDTRLTDDGRWEQIFDKVAQGRPGSANNVFVQLGMYWQLHLAYDNAAQPLAFFNEFFRLWKGGSYSGYSYDDRVALIASQVAHRDLTEFFTRWGMTLSSGVKAILDDYPAENRAIWYLNDASRTYRLEGGTSASGTASVTASAEGSKVTLTLSHTDSQHILGYEIRRNGIPIAFTPQSVYVDDLGAANNLTYTYSVVPVDKLGHLGHEAESNEVLVAYDKTIDAGLYTLERDGDTVTITMQDGPVNVTGIKLTGAHAMSGSYNVTAQVSTQEEPVTAKTGTLSGSSLTAYFNKPGTGPEDTRIWTYSVTSLTLTGIPEDVSVQLLDYPGDRVDFYQGAAVGVLKNEYRYGDGADDVVEAGTLVVLGTYRGDPVYNYVEIEARYNTTGEAAEANGVTTIQRAMNGYGLLLAEVPADGAVSDTSDGFFLFVPDLEAEEKLNTQSGVTDPYPLEIRANFYRTDTPGSTQSKRLTSQTLWLSFPDGETETGQHTWPLIDLTSDPTGMKG